MKKFKINPRSLLKLLAAGLLFGIYWYWINQKLITEPKVFGLTGFFLLMCFSTAYFPLPANLLVLGAVKSSEPWLVAIVAGFATIIAYLTEYIFFTLLFKFNRIANFKNSWLYQQAAPLFERAKFFILAFASFLPIPSEPLRIYAITRKYSKYGYMLAGFVGRIPRYYLLGYYGKAYVNSPWFLIAVVLFPVVFLLLIRGGVSLFSWTKAKLRDKPEESSVSMPVSFTSSGMTRKLKND